MIETLKEVREALDDACGGRCNAEYNPCWQRQAIDQLDALIAATEKADQLYEARFKRLAAMEASLAPEDRIAYYVRNPHELDRLIKLDGLVKENK